MKKIITSLLLTVIISNNVAYANDINNIIDYAENINNQISNEDKTTTISHINVDDDSNIKELIDNVNNIFNSNNIFK